ncbi:MAG: hypothetical protein OEY67_01310 [Gammaproteobacteria bacterium]|nr:hypothetical protein [Gammaproteobacteria bacterium]
MIKVWAALILIAAGTNIGLAADDTKTAPVMPAADKPTKAATVPMNPSQWKGPDDVLKAAKLGNPEAQLEMGILFEFGFYMKDNKAPALAWYILSANQGNIQAAQRRDILQAKMTPAEIEQANKMAPTLAKDGVLPPSPPANEPVPLGGTVPAQPSTTPMAPNSDMPSPDTASPQPAAPSE